MCVCATNIGLDDIDSTKRKHIVIDEADDVNTIYTIPTACLSPCRQVLRSELNYWKVEEPSAFTPDKFPVFIGYNTDNERDIHFYGLPIHEYPGLFKVCYHSPPPGRAWRLVIFWSFTASQVTYCGNSIYLL